MTKVTQGRVARTRDYLLASQLPEDTKDGLSTLLDAAAAACNGTADRVAAMADAILALALHETRQAVRAPATIQQAIERHVQTCPLAVAGRRGALMALLMRPWPWITASVVAFSPHAPSIIETIARVVK